MGESSAHCFLLWVKPQRRIAGYPLYGESSTNNTSHAKALYAKNKQGNQRQQDLAPNLKHKRQTREGSMTHAQREAPAHNIAPVTPTRRNRPYHPNGQPRAAPRGRDKHNRPTPREGQATEERPGLMLATPYPSARPNANPSPRNRPRRHSALSHWIAPCPLLIPKRILELHAHLTRYLLAPSRQLRQAFPSLCTLHQP